MSKFPTDDGMVSLLAINLVKSAISETIDYFEKRPKTVIKPIMFGVGLNGNKSFDYQNFAKSKVYPRAIILAKNNHGINGTQVSQGIEFYIDLDNIDLTFDTDLLERYIAINAVQHKV